METTKIGWTVDLEYICVIARQWLWDEDKEYEKCEQLLLGMMDGTGLPIEEQKQIAVQILEGRKIIRGMNEGFLEDDGELIRPLHTLANKYKDRADVLELEKHIESHPWLYVDTFCGGFSIQEPGSKYGRGYRDYDLSHMIDWRMFGQKNLLGPRVDECTDPLEAGTLLLSNPGFAKKVLGKPCNNPEEVMKKLTSYYNIELEKLKKEGIDYKDMTHYQQRIYERNMYACKEYWLVFPYNNPYGESDLENEGIDYNIFNAKQKIEKEQRIEQLTNEAIRKRLEKENGPRSDKDGWFTQIPEPDRKTPEFKGEYFSMYGWIDTDGTWYSCGFGGHGSKASWIIRSLFKNEYREFVDTMKIGREIEDSFLESIGWVKFHNPHVGETPYWDMGGNRKPSFPQMDRIMDIQKQFGLGIYNDSYQSENEEDEDRW